MESMKKEMNQKLILQYFNRVLRDQGILSQKDYQRMSLLINSKYKAAPKDKVLRKQTTIQDVE